LFDDDDQYDSEDPFGESDATPRERSEGFIGTAIFFESALAFTAAGLGWLLDVPAWASASFDSGEFIEVLSAVGVGILATLPLIGLFVWLQYASFESLDELQDFLHHEVAPLFQKASLLELGLISLAAGLGEEALFRGVLQTYFQTAAGIDASPAFPILFAAILFGLVHFVSSEYFLLSTIVGFYLGVWFWWTGDIIVPITIHALYDWFALAYLKYTAPVEEEELNEQQS